MKTTIKLAVVALVSLLSFSTFAQVGPKDNGTTNLHVNLSDVYEITVSQPDITIPMNTVAHFQNGSTSGEIAKHLQVTATQKYEVKVVAKSELANGENSIPVNTIDVKVKGNENMALGAAPAGFKATHGTVALSTTDSDALIQTNSGSAKMGYNIEYIIPAERTKDYTDKKAGTYTTTVTYNLYAL
ncbi:hypothetical protein [Myroides injenensis]|uniref:hypothetical protein n=1 Tax=Myroides injenensis TaxID=1183151 RepID=UPI00028957AC|nr:hypothetical protein [Myroides injenensis]